MMKKIYIRLLTLILIISVTTGCKKASVLNHEKGILFQLEYVNYAWGYQHNGFLIDTEGNILLYDNPEKWNFPDDNLYLTPNQVAENITMCKATGKKIDDDELHKFAGFIRNIASSKVSAQKHSGADEGTLEYICYQYSDTNPGYKGYLIKMEGDITCENLNFYSKKVTAWMKDINKSLE
jgi:hypothetical protein